MALLHHCGRALQTKMPQKCSALWPYSYLAPPLCIFLSNLYTTSLPSFPSMVHLHLHSLLLYPHTHICLYCSGHASFTVSLSKRCNKESHPIDHSHWFGLFVFQYPLALSFLGAKDGEKGLNRVMVVVVSSHSALASLWYSLAHTGLCWRSKLPSLLSLAAC